MNEELERLYEKAKSIPGLLANPADKVVGLDRAIEKLSEWSGGPNISLCINALNKIRTDLLGKDPEPPKRYMNPEGMPTKGFLVHAEEKPEPDPNDYVNVDAPTGYKKPEPDNLMDRCVAKAIKDKSKPEPDEKTVIPKFKDVDKKYKSQKKLNPIEEFAKTIQEIDKPEPDTRIDDFYDWLCKNHQIGTEGEITMKYREIRDRKQGGEK